MSDIPAPQPTDPVQSAATEVLDSLESNEVSEETEATEEEVEESELEASAESEEEAENKESEKKTWKLKIGGKDVEINDEAELIKRAQMGYSADQKWQEAAKIRKEMESFVQTLQKDPAYALAQMGFDVDSMAEQHIQRRIEEMQKSPEQLERERIQKELEDLKSEREKEREQARQSELQRIQDQYAVEIENQISDALDSSKTLPKRPYVVKRIADAMLLAYDRGKHDVSVEDVLPVVEREIKDEIQEMFMAMPEELVEAVIGKDVLNKIRKRRVKRVKAVDRPKVSETGRAEIQKAKEEAAESDQEKLNAKDFFRNLGSF